MIKYFSFRIRRLGIVTRGFRRNTVRYVSYRRSHTEQINKSKGTKSRPKSTILSRVVDPFRWRIGSATR